MNNTRIKGQLIIGYVKQISISLVGKRTLLVYSKRTTRSFSRIHSLTLFLTLHSKIQIFPVTTTVHVQVHFSYRFMEITMTITNFEMPEAPFNTSSRFMNEPKGVHLEEILKTKVSPITKCTLGLGIFTCQQMKKIFQRLKWFQL